MCTVTFAPRADGYLAGMNRDELRDRAAGSPPRIYEGGEGAVAYPSEPGGGTWIAAKQDGILFAILNWACIDPALLGEKAHSRGEIIPHVLPARRTLEAERILGRLDLFGYLPFRLVGIFPQEVAVREWTWDGVRSGELQHAWESRNWFSSSRSDAMAAKERGAVCRKAWQSPSAGTASWMRELHRSHLPRQGAFSLCVHRPDAATVSYTEVDCDRDAVTMAYLAGNPCASAVAGEPVCLRRTATGGAEAAALFAPGR